MKLNSEMREQFATEIFEWLYAHELWKDVKIYFNGKSWGTYNYETKEYYYNEHKYYEKENDNPKDYFEYVSEPNILSMSFEGGLYYVLNNSWENEYWADLEIEFNNLFKKYGLYFELGYAWSLTAYELEG